jgi:hypothetical protein
MGALLKKILCSLALLDLARGSETSSAEAALDVGREKRDTGNTTLKAPIIAVPSEHWYVPISPFLPKQKIGADKHQGRSRWQLVYLRNSGRHASHRLSYPSGHFMARNVGNLGYG